MDKLLLFDIDGTLLARGSGHKEAFVAAFMKVHGVYAAIEMIKYQGKTDQQIIREVLLKVGIDAGAIDAKMAEFMAVMADYFAAIQPYTRSEMLPGVDKTLSLLEAKGYLMGLVTGNLEPIAHGKLASVGIDKYFKLGGFGSEASERSQLVGNAVRKAREQFGFDENGTVLLFGDAPQDMQAAVQGGATPIGVASGIYSEEELRAAGASKVIAGIGKHEAVLAVLDQKL